MRCRWTRSPGRHGTIESRESLERVGAGSWERTGAGRTAGPGRTAQKQRREVQRSRRRRRKQLLTTGTASGRRGQVPMSAQVSPQSKFSAVQCSAVQCSASRRKRMDAGSGQQTEGMRCSADGGSATRCVVGMGGEHAEKRSSTLVGQARARARARARATAPARCLQLHYISCLLEC